jgi:hypothetical protein
VSASASGAREAQVDERTHLSALFDRLRDEALLAEEQGEYEAAEHLWSQARDVEERLAKLGRDAALSPEPGDEP